uniref:Uncharacterized protein n=1 Tax=Chromera velia CCMP2878 TaxID=1169474 RepID=A0A0G4FCI6_9ALVE|eukprot:Cvel_16372.t1-p1 / transcript=Cvel_16372.t1 / gene=Cvel_16372 / organism=Chromera_velia_CCMP2878 / gene_product=hypothetical protein / transcript_product=hypothetical protein / location=Cvel_scaffold1258:37966-42983(+) / protein_length=260 / sequence_SO=supercontig / SO=protein_coding / is_pseudo=false
MQHARESKVLQRVLHQKGFTQLVAVEVHHPKVNHALQSIHEIPLDAGGFPDFGRLSLHEHEASGKKRRRSESRPPRHNSSSSSSPESPVPSDEPSDAEDGLSAEPAESKPKRARGDAEGRSPESGESAPGGASAGSVRPSRPGGGSFSPQGAVPAMPSSSETLHLQQSHRPHPDDARPESVGNPPSVGDRLPFQSSSVHLSSSGGRGSPSGAREATESLKDSAEESLLPGDVVGSPQQQEQGQGVEKGALGCYSQGQDSR